MGFSAKRFRAFIVGSVIELYTAFVMMKLWNWFVVGAINVPMIGYWQMYGIGLIVGLWTMRDSRAEDSRWALVIDMVYAAIPVERRAEIDERMEAELEQVWSNVWSSLFGTVVGSSTILAIGFVIHAFI